MVSSDSNARRPMTLTQKILAQHAVGLPRPWVQAGDMLQVRVDWTIASELAWNGMDRTYSLLGRPKIANPDRFYLALDHTVDPGTLASDPRARKLADLSRAFAKESGLKHFYDANVTIMHTKFYRDLVQPGEVVLGADSHTSSHGGMGAFAVGLGGADITAAMVLGQTWLEVPEAIAVEYEGEPQFGIGGKDIILKTLGALGRNTVAMERSVEFRGNAAQSFTTDMRFTICNMTAEFGGLNGIFEPDEQVAEWLMRRRRGYNDTARYFRADDDAPYIAHFPIQLAALPPQVAKPFSPDNVFDVADVIGQELDGCFIGACTTTEEELALAALMLDAALKSGATPKPVESGMRIVVPGDMWIADHFRKTGLWDIYEQAGFVVDVPGCSMCLGIASRKAGKGETWLSSQNRNFENRMGEGSLAWLASAATVAASAFDMRVTDPRPLLAQVDRDRLDSVLMRRRARLVPEIHLSEPEMQVVAQQEGAHATETASGGTIRAKVQRFGDAVDTDAIIPGEFCHLTKLEDLGDKCFYYVRPEFRQRAKDGATIVVAGEGWGSGSSREHAVWALQGAGIQAIIARSYAFIHKRNLVNEALPYLIITDPDFYALADESAELEIDLATGLVRDLATGREFQAQVASPMIQALTAEGGLVAAVKRHGADVFTALSA
ncbi:MAG: 3-isopropylmalate dehydratase large subunit [Ktedonobacterales bacterium]|jgi:aconitate hydratase/homoaconitate hydratase|nr:MAG: 3-isopropylmalate dehydratase large subunit [Ktedonobacterales bacterium]